MGPVLHRYLDWDERAALAMFQSPSRWGQCCISLVVLLAAFIVMFQSPSRWGQCCIFGVPAGQVENHFVFQSPSRWGQCCIQCIGGVGVDIVQVSVPFSMGPVLHR